MEISSDDGQSERECNMESSDDSELDNIEASLYSQIYYITNDEGAMPRELAASSPSHICEARQEVTCSSGNNSPILAITLDKTNLPHSENVPCDCDSSTSQNVSKKLKRTKKQREECVLVDGESPPDKCHLSNLSCDDYVVLLSSEGDTRDGFKEADSRLSSGGPTQSDSDDDNASGCDFEYNVLSGTPHHDSSLLAGKRISMEDVFASLADCDWSVCDDDKGRIGSATRGRYYSVRCHNCNEKGHMVRDCRRPKKAEICSLCGAVGHGNWRCSQKVCLNCEQIGHLFNNCDVQHRRSLFCRRCKSRGHLKKGCSELWRQFHQSLDLDAMKNLSPVKRNACRYCANCGGKGHFTHECKARYPNPNRPPLSVFVNVYNTDEAVLKTKPTKEKEVFQATASQVAQSAPQRNVKKLKRKAVREGDYITPKRTKYDKASNGLDHAEELALNSVSTLTNTNPVAVPNAGQRWKNASRSEPCTTTARHHRKAETSSWPTKEQYHVQDGSKDKMAARTRRQQTKEQYHVQDGSKDKMAARTWQQTKEQYPVQDGSKDIAQSWQKDKPRKGRKRESYTQDEHSSSAAESLRRDGSFRGGNRGRARGSSDGAAHGRRNARKDYGKESMNIADCSRDGAAKWRRKKSKGDGRLKMAAANSSVKSFGKTFRQERNSRGGGAARSPAALHAEQRVHWWKASTETTSHAQGVAGKRTSAYTAVTIKQTKRKKYTTVTFAY